MIDEEIDDTNKLVRVFSTLILLSLGAGLMYLGYSSLFWCISSPQSQYFVIGAISFVFGLVDGLCLILGMTR